MSSAPFWIGLAAAAVGSLIMHRFNFRWWIVVPVLLAWGFAAVTLKDL